MTDSSLESSTKPADEQQYLNLLGRRVRERREAAHLSRRLLAVRAGVSERYLAQLELGSGNASVLLLRKLARALDCRLVDLINEIEPQAPGRQAALGEALAILGSVDEASIAQAVALLQTRFGAQGVLRRSRVALVGLRGAGKSTLGQRLAQAMSVPFVELDAEIEKDMGCDLASIFSLYGQDAYRAAEGRVLAHWTQGDACFVMATGGSIVTAADTYDRLRTSCFTVWLQADPQDHMARVQQQGDLRPMRGHEHAMTELRAILGQREALYRQADLVINTSRQSEIESVAAVLAGLH